ncbi:MAG: hypothetical protein HUJ22_12325 [Gracilimonas sp.]|uniref:hypothetical protein n=1 Tax=Gracilimonas sp. TaxID=1974203 RepID=UPI0019BD6E45|nr:hypothetical protein [Gracilimonas sp.]MBD3617345.1 hypothetical protein [Gracilimonas sp.]
MEILIVLLIVGFWGGLSYVISTFFDDREIGQMNVFWLSLLLSPIIGILIGLSSKRVQKTKKSVLPNYKSKTHKLNKELSQIKERLKEIKEHEELGITENSDEEKEMLKARYFEVESKIKSYKKRQKVFDEYNKKNFRNRKL